MAPSWFVFGELDKNIPAEAHLFMAERAGGREVLEIEEASHAVGVSHPEEVAEVILRAQGRRVAPPAPTSSLKTPTEERGT